MLSACTAMLGYLVDSCTYDPMAKTRISNGDIGRKIDLPLPSPIQICPLGLERLDVLVPLPGLALLRLLMLVLVSVAMLLT